MKILFFYRGAEVFGIQYMSAVLKEAGHQVEMIFDPGFDNNFFWQIPALKKLRVPEKLVKKARDFDPDIVAFSCITNLYPYVREMARLLKIVLRHESVFVIGGIHPTVLPELVIGEDCFDVLCRGEGEQALLELANKISHREDYASIPNMWVKDCDGKIHKNENQYLIENLDELPFPDKDLFYRHGSFYRNVAVMTGRDCPHSCTFCVNSFLGEFNNTIGKKPRRHSVERVIEELALYKEKYRATSITFQDDTFTMAPSWLREFSSEYRKRIGLPFNCNVSPTTINGDTISSLVEAGCASVNMGVQSGCPEMLDRLNRPGTVEQIVESAKIIKSTKIKLVGEYIFGLPHETEEDILRSIELNSKIRSDNVSTFTFYPFPGTRANRECQEQGLLDRQQNRRVEMGEGSYHTGVMIEHTNRDMVMQASSLFPLVNKIPKFIGVPLFKFMLKRKYGILTKLLGVLSIPCMNFWLARDRIYDNLHMAWRLYKNR